MAASSVTTAHVLPQSRAPRTRGLQLTPTQVREHRLKRRVGVAWALLVLNVLTFAAGLSVIPIPSVLGKAITQGSLSLALLVALTVNRKGLFRPNIFLCLVSLLAVEVMLTCILNHVNKGTLYRTFRFDEFVAVMWLLSPYWARKDMLLLRCHLKTLIVVLASVLLGLLISPGRVLHNRFAGVIWPVPGTQVAHYAAIVLGLVILLWFCGQLRGRLALPIAAISSVILVGTHTRTALTGVLGGIIVAGFSLIAVTPRVRRFFGAIGTVAVIAIVTSSAAISAYLARGEGTAQLFSLSGRTTYWNALLAFPRTRLQEIFGFGLVNGTFNGQPIDSNWLSSYQQQGLVGVTLCICIVIFLYIACAFQTDRTKRALALFLTTYCLLASITEDGFATPTTYLLDVMLAASLLIPISMRRASPDEE
jgi:hypothetical protein